MTKFESIFGIKIEQVKRTCVLLPVVPKGLLNSFKIDKLCRGKLYASGNNENCTVINTGIGAGFTGDAVLYLKNSPCEKIILFGSCGLIEEKQGLSLGALVMPVKCYANESFSEMLSGDLSQKKVFVPHKEFVEDLFSFKSNADIKKVICSTLASLKLEEEMPEYFFDKGIEVVDMESSAFLSAAEYIGKKALALFFVSDIIGKNPFYQDLEPRLKAVVDNSIQKASKLILEFTRLQH